MVRKEYSAGGVKHPFWFLEFKKAAILRDQGVTWEGLRTRSREENLFSAASPARAEMTCNTVAARMQTLPDSFLPSFSVMETTAGLAFGYSASSPGSASTLIRLISAFTLLFSQALS